MMVLSLAACGKSSGGNTTTDPDEQITLTIGIPTLSRVTEWDNNKLTLWLEEKTGYNLEFVHFSSADDEMVTQITTMVSGGEHLPDLLLSFNPGSGVIQTLGDGGYLVDLGEMFFDNEKVMKNYDYDDMIKKNLDPDMLQRVYTEGRNSKGQWFGFPRIGSSINDQPATMVYINRAWLDKLGLEKPTNLDELYEVGKAFMEQDPNGNGKQDEIAMLGGVNVGKGDLTAWIVNNYIYVNDSYLYNVDDSGKLYLPYDMDEYREGLKTARKFYEGGLLNSLNWTITARSELTAMFTPVDEVAKLGVVATHLLMSTTQDNPVMLEYEPLAPFEGSYAAHNPLALSFSNYITADCEHPEAAFNLLCTLATPEGTRAQRYGEEGVDWQWVTDKYNGRQGVEQINTDAYSGQTDSTWGLDINCTYWVSEPGDGKDEMPSYIPNLDGPIEEDTWTQRRTKMNRGHAAQYMARAKETDPKYMIFKVAYTDEENEALGNFESDIRTYAKTSRAKFVTGEWDIYDDAAWNNYCDTLHKMGTETILTINQTAWDRQQEQLKNVKF